MLLDVSISTMPRPKGTVVEPRRTIQIRISTTERREFDRRAAEVGLTLSEWIRLLARRDAGMWTGGNDSQDPDKDV